jgi:hypothetical protein
MARGKEAKEGRKETRSKEPTENLAAAEEQEASKDEDIDKDDSKQESKDLTRDERRKAKKARKKAKRLAQQAEASSNDDKVKVKEGIADEAWEIVNKNKCKSEGKEDAGKSKKRKRGGAADEETGTKSGQLQLTWLTPDPRPPLTVSMVRELLLHLLGGEAQPSWLRVQGQAPPTVTVVVFADYLGHESYRTDPKSFPFLSTLKQDSAVLRAPGTHIEVFPMAADLCTCSITKTQIQKNKKAKSSPQLKEKESEQGDYVMYPTDILLTDEELMENKYPHCGNTEETSRALPEGYLMSPHALLKSKGQAPTGL